ncbi:DUF6428 family protein [Leptospira sp. WS39.C2]
MKTLTWFDFKKNLDLYPDLQLKFVYNDNDTIYPNYHITEFKLATIEAVDCGGNFDTWKEIILQVLEPNTKAESDAMSIKKINSIVSKVSNLIIVPENAILRVEFGNTSSAMRQYFISNIKIEASELVVYLADGKTECKASSSCGTPKVNKDLSLVKEFPSNLTQQKNSCCSPKSVTLDSEKVGCC